MVGGHVIEVAHRQLRSERGVTRDVLRVWCIDRSNADECAVYIEPGEVIPKPGDQVWWQSGKVYLTSRERGLSDYPLPKVGYFFDPRRV